MTLQETGGTRKTIEKGLALIQEMLPLANQSRRETCSASELILALQCGGSDAYSGMTANPSLGYAADMLVRHGGTAVLAETPEIYGAEHLLTRRAVSKDIGEKLIERIKWWEAYCARNGGEMNNNPSPGNKGRWPHHHSRKISWRGSQGGGRQTSPVSLNTQSGLIQKALSSWTARDSIPVRSPDRSRAEALSWHSRPEGGPVMAANRHHR